MRYAEGNPYVGRYGLGADFVYYDPWNRRRMTKVQYENLRTRGRQQMPVGHPTGFDFDTPTSGWDGKTLTPTGNEDLAAHVPNPVDFLGREAEIHAKTGLFWVPAPTDPGRGGVYPGFNDLGRDSHSPMQVGSSSPQEPKFDEVDVVRRFLREVGLSEANTSGSWDAMLQYLHGRLNM